MGFLDDVEYIGTAEEREAQGKKDKKQNERCHLTGGAFPANFGLAPRPQNHDSDTVSFEELIEHIADLKRKASQSKTDEEKAALLEEVEALEKIATGRKPHHFRPDSAGVDKSVGRTSPTEAFDVSSDENV
mmetsp:Transcript_23477/g.65314  ORF Transcript_23477/g.65314 Transcript_23477/m.65314 type:complete len:131 (-) Transcript_23477:65-457(-)